MDIIERDEEEEGGNVVIRNPAVLEMLRETDDIEMQRNQLERSGPSKKYRCGIVVTFLLFALVIASWIVYMTAGRSEQLQQSAPIGYEATGEEMAMKKHHTHPKKHHKERNEVMPGPAQLQLVDTDGIDIVDGPV